ncbi:MAG: hypothetical protein E7301_07410 [Butyrivibrio sp.]|nr:hypothetical protein [Butyrivibrio sp.]
MKTFVKKALSKWYICLGVLYIVAVFAMFMIVGKDSYIAIADNLDLFVAQMKMMSNTGTFFMHDAEVPFLGGISRDNLPGEFYFYTILCMIFPDFTAYVLNYICKIIIGVLSGILLIRDFDLKDDAAKGIGFICAFAYGIINVFPAFGIPFASIPLMIFLLRRIYRYGLSVKTIPYYVILFLYPVVSYFSYFGMFILGYLVLAIIWRWISDRRISWSLVISLFVLAIGFVLLEYRLFGQMLFTDEVTIRSTMKDANMNAAQIMTEIWGVFKNGMMHADDAHQYFVFPICCAYFVFLNARYIVKKDFKGIFKDIYNFFMLLIVFNSFVYGIYYSEAMRNLVAFLVPPLTGWQFNRTIFFNPFLWYAMLFIFCRRLYLRAEGKKLLRAISYAIPVIAVFVILICSSHYNDVYDTAYGTAYRIKTGKTLDRLSYGEFYSKELFDKIKSDLQYEEDEWAVAYGMHPAILEYNGISTLDGYLGFYTQEYKEQFRKVIAPALDRMEQTRIYFDDWGARCYLYSGTDDSIVMATKSMQGVTDNDIYIDAKALYDLDCDYIFSRIDISNADEAGLELINTYSDPSSPYTIYVYGIADSVNG